MQCFIIPFLSLSLSQDSVARINVNMLPSLLLSVFSTLAAAVTLPFSEFESGLGSLKPRSLGSPRNLFNRQSTFSCNNGYFCNEYQTCCGTDCCNTGYTCSSIFTCDPDSSVLVSSPPFVILPVSRNLLLIGEVDMYSRPNSLWVHMLR
jgi:hypothetical protein